MIKIRGGRGEEGGDSVNVRDSRKEGKRKRELVIQRVDERESWRYREWMREKKEGERARVDERESGGRKRSLDTSCMQTQTYKQKG